jgi:hypothetical protein
MEKNRRACNKHPIAILMMNSPNIPEYARYTTEINYIYATRYGYSFLVQRCPRTEDMDKDWYFDGNNEYLFVWSKAAIVRQFLPFYEYLLFIDSDAIFFNQEKSIEEFIKEHVGPETCIVAAQDCKEKQYCFHQENLNAGVMLFRNRPETMTILNDWVHQENHECKDWKYKHPREQQCMNIIRKKYGNQIHIIPVEEMNGSDGKWIRHYMAESAQTRKDVFKKYLSNLDYKEMFSNDDFHSQEKNNNHTSLVIVLFFLFILLVLFIVLLALCIKKP